MKRLLTLAVPLLLLAGCDRPEPPTVPPDPSATGPSVPMPAAAPRDAISTSDGVHPIDRRPADDEPTLIREPAQPQRERPRPPTQCEGKIGDELAECLRAGSQERPQESRTTPEDVPLDDDSR